MLDTVVRLPMTSRYRSEDPGELSQFLMSRSSPIQVQAERVGLGARTWL